MSQPSTPPTTRSLGRYELLLQLGQGGMGEVHLARLRGAGGFEKLCIVKTILPQMQSDAQFVDRFHHEARVLVQLTHSHIAQVYDMGEADGTLYMAIEYVSGVDLSRVLGRLQQRAEPMPLPFALYTLQQLLEALGYAHRKAGPDGTGLGIVHRDVSPQNVMVSYEGEVKVIDFGLAKSSARSKHTMPSTVLGKLGYMSPEQARALPVDHRSDIYSAGIVAWEVLTGQTAFDGGTLAEMLAKMANPNIPPPSSVRQDISPALEQAVMRALAVDPAARFQRADDFARALNEIAVREGQTVGAEEVGNFIRAMCPDEFQAERALQSRLSSLKKKVGSSPGSGTRSLPPELDGTLVRSSGSLTPAQRAASLPPQQLATPAPTGPSSNVQLSPSMSQPISVPKSRAPVIALGLVIALAAGGGTLYVLSRGGSTQPPDPVPTTETPQPDVPALPPVAEAPKEPEVEAPADPEPQPGEAELVKVDEPVFKVQFRKGDALIMLKKKEKLAGGDRLLLVGEPQEDGRRPLLAQGAVLSVNRSLVTVLVEDDVQLSGKVFAAKDVGPKRARRPKGHTTVAAATPPGTSTVVVPATGGTTGDTGQTGQAGQQGTNPGTATTASATGAAKLGDNDSPAMDVVAFPGAGKNPTGTTTATNPATTTTAPPVVTAPVNTKPAIKVDARIVRETSIFGDSYTLQNFNRFSLSACEVRMPDNRTFTTRPKEVILGGESLRIDNKRTRPDGRPAYPGMEKNLAFISCREGNGTVGYIHKR